MAFSQDFCARKKEKKETNVDIVFVIDATESMSPLIDKIKEITSSFRSNFETKLEHEKKIGVLRVKVIVFRDYYVDDVYAMEQSDFFVMPKDEDGDEREFKEFISSIQVGGGGDEPESGLEALSLAISSDFQNVQGIDSRHLIILFTDASAHDLEQQEFGTPDCYPREIPKDMDGLIGLWSCTGEDRVLLGKQKEDFLKTGKGCCSIRRR